jgi:Domain of unknown function (DUF4386)
VELENLALRHQLRVRRRQRPGLTIFAFVLLILGYLIFNSGFFPKTLGVLLAIASACYLTNSLALFLAPGVEAIIFSSILIPPFHRGTITLPVDARDGCECSEVGRESKDSDLTSNPFP